MSAAIETRDLTLRVNGETVGPLPVPVGTSLLDFCTNGSASPAAAWAAARASATPAR